LASAWPFIFGGRSRGGLAGIQDALAGVEAARVVLEGAVRRMVRD
jgi:hypothetical protein